MAEPKHRVAIIGCGRMGQVYADAYTAYPDTEIVAIAEFSEERRKAVGERFGVKALFPDAESLLRVVVPDVASVVTPVKYTRDAVVACAQAGVKGISAEKPFGGKLLDADEMVDECAARGVVFAGGNLQRAMNEVQEAALRIRKGEFGALKGASIHGFGGEISGGGCQHISVMRLFTDAEVEEVVAWGTPEEQLHGETDEILIHGTFRMSSGIDCVVFGTPTPSRGVDVWSEEGLVRWDWAPPQLFNGFNTQGGRVEIDPDYADYQWSEFGYLTGSLRSFLSAVEGKGNKLWVTGHDLRQALEVAIAAKVSAKSDSRPVKLPIEDRSMSLLPRPYRWLGGDLAGNPQSLEEASGN
jgi:predicted dehydrogenase